MRLILTFDQWTEKALRIDIALFDFLASDRGCLGARDCLERSEIAALVRTDGCSQEIGLCHTHAEELTQEAEAGHIVVIATRVLAPDESLSPPGG